MTLQTFGLILLSVTFSAFAQFCLETRHEIRLPYNRRFSSSIS